MRLLTQGPVLYAGITGVFALLRIFNRDKAPALSTTAARGRAELCLSLMLTHVYSEEELRALFYREAESVCSICPGYQNIL